jgi:hypothetical protein
MKKGSQIAGERGKPRTPQMCSSHRTAQMRTPQIGGTMSRDRATIRGRETLTLSSECLDREHADCENPDCSCVCHSRDKEREDDFDESA